MNRRGFLTGLSALIAAPAIVRAGSLMPVRGIVMDSGLIGLDIGRVGSDNTSIWMVQWGETIIHGIYPAYDKTDPTQQRNWGHRTFRTA